MLERSFFGGVSRVTQYGKTGQHCEAHKPTDFQVAQANKLVGCQVHRSTLAYAHRPTHLQVARRTGQHTSRLLGTQANTLASCQVHIQANRLLGTQANMLAGFYIRHTGQCTCRLLHQVHRIRHLQVARYTGQHASRFLHQVHRPTHQQVAALDIQTNTFAGCQVHRPTHLQVTTVGTQTNTLADYYTRQCSVVQRSVCAHAQLHVFVYVRMCICMCTTCMCSCMCTQQPRLLGNSDQKTLQVASYSD